MASGFFSSLLKHSIPWLSLLTAAFTKEQLLKKCRNVDRNSQQIKITVKAEDGSDVDISLWELQLMNFEAYHSRPEVAQLKALCFDVAAKLHDNNFIAPEESWDLTNTQIQHAFAFDEYHMSIHVGIRVKDHVFPEYFSNPVNPKGSLALRNAGTARILTNLAPTTNNVEIALPAFDEQVRIAFESLHYRHKIRQEAARLNTLPTEPEIEPADLCNLLRTRFGQVRELIASIPANNHKID